MDTGWREPQTKGKSRAPEEFTFSFRRVAIREMNVVWHAGMGLGHHLWKGCRDYVEICQNKDKRIKKEKKREGEQVAEEFGSFPFGQNLVKNSVGRKMRIEEFYFHWLPHSRIGADPSPALLPAT